MQPEKGKPIRQSRYSRKMSYSSQMRNSSAGDNLRNLDSSRINNYSEFQNVFDPKVGGLNNLYRETVKKCPTKALIHIGICLQLQQTFQFIKQLAAESGKNFSSINKFKERRQLLEGIIFAPFWHYKFQNCTVIFWILSNSLLKERFKTQQAQRQVNIFASYPQMLITDIESFKIMSRKTINLPSILNFQQQIIVLSNKFQDNTLSLNVTHYKNQKDPRKMHFTESLEKKIFQNYLFTTLKKNSLRCYHQCLKINLYILDSLSLTTGQENGDLLFSNTDNLQQIFDNSASNYLFEEVEKKYEVMVEKYKNGGPRHQKDIESQLSLNQQQLIRQVKKNVKILNQAQRQKSFIEATEKKLSANHQQILLNNKQMTKKQNNQILTELYQKLLNKFDKGSYPPSKQRSALMAEDIQTFMEQYQHNAVKSSSLFWAFNNFMKQNRGKYYQKIQHLQDQIGQNKKNQNFDNIFDHVQMKKKVLFTLEKQVKQLETKKLQIQLQSDRLKKLQRRFQLGGRLDTQGQQLYDGDSTKTIKAKQSSPTYNQINSARFYSKVNKPEKKKKKTCLTCCKCAIF